MTDRLPPHSHEAEVAVLGGMLIDPDALVRATEMLDESMFFAERHRRFFRALVGIHQRKQAIDPVTVAEELRSTGDFEAVGGMQFLATLIDAVPTAANLEYHAAIVRDKAILRRLALAAHGIVVECMADGARGSELLSVAEARISAAVAAEDKSAEHASHIRDLLWSRMEAMEQRSQRGGAVTGLSTGIEDLDEITAGFQDGDLIIVAARPSMGKSALADNVTAHIAVLLGVGVGSFSLEMSKESKVDRLLSSEARVNASRIRTGNLRDDDYPRLAQAAGLLNKAPILIDDRAAPTIHELRARAYRMRRQFEAVGVQLGMIVVDYLQLMSGGGGTKDGNRQQEVSDISRGLKALAKELHVPVVALSQLSRAVEQRPDKRPLLSDLRESGSIEQDADVVLLLYRPEYYLGPTDKDGNSLEGRAEIIVGKQRNGATGTVHAHFHKQFTRFESIAARSSGGRDNPAWTQR